MRCERRAQRREICASDGMGVRAQMEVHKDAEDNDGNDDDGSDDDGDDDGNDDDGIDDDGSISSDDGGSVSGERD